MMLYKPWAERRPLAARPKAETINVLFMIDKVEMRCVGDPSCRFDPEWKPARCNLFVFLGDYSAAPGTVMILRGLGVLMAGTRGG